MAKFDGIIEQTTHYYLYNGTLAYSTNQGVQKYKYNGKKLDRTHGLDWYDYGASQYDPASGRFTSIDPFCEKYYNINPYMYCAGKHSNKLRQLDQKKQIKNQKISNDYLKELEILLTLQIISSIFLLYRNAEKIIQQCYWTSMHTE